MIGLPPSPTRGHDRSTYPSPSSSTYTTNISAGAEAETSVIVTVHSRKFVSSARSSIRSVTVPAVQNSAQKEASLARRRIFTELAHEVPPLCDRSVRWPVSDICITLTLSTPGVLPEVNCCSSPTCQCWPSGSGLSRSPSSRSLMLIVTMMVSLPPDDVAVTVTTWLVASS